MTWEIITYHDRAADFAKVAVPWLALHEAEENVQLGLVLALAKKSESMRGRFWLARDSGGTPGLSAFLLPDDPRCGLSRCEDPAGIAALVEKIREEKIRIQAVSGPRESVEEFRERWVDATDADSSLNTRQGVFVLREIEVAPPFGGTLRPARPRDADVLAAWMDRFMTETGAISGFSDMRRLARTKIESGEIFLWEVDGVPVAMSGKAGPTLHGIRVNFVFTPAHLRGMGYASACVAALTKHLLDSGMRECYLFTDLNNPTSNKIYQKIGYKQVGEFAVYEFSY